MPSEEELQREVDGMVERFAAEQKAQQEWQVRQVRQAEAYVAGTSATPPVDVV